MGQEKIFYGLKEKKVSEYNIRKAMKEIDEETYRETLKKLAEKKYGELKTDQYLVRKKKTMDYLMQKGYEPDLISQVLISIVNKP